MKIAIDARLTAYREGGIAEYMRRLIEHIPELWAIQHRRKPRTDRDRQYYAFTPPHHRLERIALGVELLPLRLDLLHAADFIPPLFGAKHFVITVHDLNFLHYPQFQTPDSLRYYAGQIKAATEQAAQIMADSEATKIDLCNMLGVPAEKITVHMLGVDPMYHPLPADQVQPVLDRLKLPRGYILFVGTFEPRKNLPGLLTAYRHLRDELPDAPPLVIVGRRGWLYEDIFRNVSELGLDAQVRWLEDAAFADMPALYNGAAVLTLPSHYEGFGFPPLEAMACGVPTVVSDRGSLPEVVADTGLMIDPDDSAALTAALRRALTDSAFRDRSSAAGLQRSSQFTWQHTAQIAREVYHKVLA
ncbi:MAG: glycosyltransferase family 1 protein [Anaerolineae bacterium]